MEQTPGDSFDDPALKAAIRQARGNQRASEQLRARVLASFSTNGAPAARKAPPVSRLRRLLVAAAAILLIAAGIYRWMASGNDDYYYNNNDYAMQLDRVLDSMAHSADSLPQQADFQSVNASLTNLPMAAGELQSRLGRPIPVVPLSASGWQIKSIGTAAIDKSPVAEVQYARGNQTVTLLSLPASLLSGARDGDHYEKIEDGHALAGYICKGSLDCVVGSPGVSLDDAVALRNSVSSASGGCQ